MLIRICLLALLAASPAFASPGDLDPTFGWQGNVETPLGPSNVGISILTDPVGRLVVGSSGFDDSIAVVRYLEDGALDPSFGTGGIVAIPEGHQSPNYVGLARQTDGKLLTAVTATDVGVPAFTDLFVARLEADGDLDGTFGSGGTSRVDVSPFDQLWVLLLQDDGKIVLAGNTGSFLLVRLDETGARDPSFGVNGVVTTDLVGESGVQGLAQQSDGKLVAAGFTGSGSSRDVAVVRYETDGSLDATFGTGGIAILPVSASDRDEARSVAMQPDGKIVVAGDSGPFLAPEIQLFVARLDTNGALDPDFGESGIFELESTLTYSVLTDVAGRIVVVGGRIGHFSTFEYARTLVARLLPDGTLDPDFGDGGEVVHLRYSLPLPRAPNEIAIDVVEDARGRLVTVGWSQPDATLGGAELSLSRFLVGTCGNGEIETDEDCDDGNVLDGDCCSSACRLDAPGTTCGGPGDLCASSACDGAGACVTNTAPDPTCEESLGPTLGTLRVTSPSNPNRRKLRWTWIHGAAEIEDFGEPRGETDLSLCVYDGAGELVSRLHVPGGATCLSGPCWTASRSTLTYRDPIRERAGLELLRLRGGAGRASVTAIASGHKTPVPTLPLATPVTVQLRGSNGGCWGTSFDATSIQRNDEVSFRARAKD